MSSVIVVTNFTASSRNALEYACGFMRGRQVKIVLLRVFSFSSGFAGEGVSMAALTEVSAADERMLREEKERVQALYPDAQLETRLVSGQFTDALAEEVAAEETRLVVMGKEGDYNDLMSWDDHMLEAFIDLPVPALMVPASVSYAGLRRMAFACNYQREDLYGPVQTLRRLLARTGSMLHFVHIYKTGEGLPAGALEWKAKWQEELTGERVVFEELEATDVVNTLDAFSKDRDIDLLAIRPHRHGVWANVFGKNNTRAIAHLNTIPILALRGGGI
ncbi:nucleotide-binding universal stress UspA family protein [Filimonas zeae]|uniref:UspA domain-containing protein n=1 Tax=Filimonas zeae TaxID=1737353 RepID=A0A917J2V3_9BACT|nr:universal stress protein [Filimonas zeae]MDR6341033.1 nucleotide-binding universal stress UspA family protein [Filimonas zeae]GGH77494.1 hypothetical protein GCM10011379_43930 [Filimonas zeae]